MTEITRAIWQTDEQYRQSCDWVNTRPKAVKEVLLKHFNPPMICYKIAGEEGHYRLFSVCEHPDGDITIKLIDLGDGAFKVGVDPEDIIKCGCLIPQYIQEASGDERSRDN